MSELKNEAGETVEAYLPEEVEQIKAQAVEEAKGELQQQLEEREQEIEKLSKQTGDFARLRELKDKAEKEKKDLSVKIDNLEKGVEQKITAVSEGLRSDYTEDLINQYANGDENLKKTLKDNYGLLNLPANSNADIQKRIEAAATLSGLQVNQSALNSAVLSGAGGAFKAKSSAANNPEVLELAAQFGITPDEVKTYGK